MGMSGIMLRLPLSRASIPSRAEWQYSNSLHATETGVSYSCVSLLWLVSHFTFPGMYSTAYGFELVWSEIGYGIVEPRYNEPPYNEDPGKMNKILQPSNGKTYGQES